MLELAAHLKQKRNSTEMQRPRMNQNSLAWYKYVFSIRNPTGAFWACGFLESDEEESVLEEEKTSDVAEEVTAKP